jgi:hypothetical protein
MKIGGLAYCKTTVKLLKNTLRAVCQRFAVGFFGSEIMFAVELEMTIP